MPNVDITLTAKDNTKPGFDSAASNAQKFAASMSGLNKKVAENWVASQQSAKEIASMNQQFYAQGSATTKAKSGVDALMAAYRGFVAYSVPIVAAGAAIKKAYDFSRIGAEAEYTRIKFDRLAMSVGTTGDAFLNQLRTATRGTVSDFGLMKQGADLVQLGLANTSSEAIRLSRVMTALGMDTGELTLALANQSKRRLDQLGLSLTAFNKIESKLRDSGMNKQDAFKEAFIQTAEQTVGLTGNMADTKLGDYLRFEAGIQNAKVSAGAWLANTIFPTGPLEYSPWDRAVGNARMKGTADYNLLIGGAPLGIPGAPQYGGGATRPGDETARNSSYAAMARYYMAPERTAGAGGEAPEVDYALLLDGAMKITNQTQKYRDVTASLNEQLMDQTVLLQQTAEKYGENSKKAKEAYEAVQETQNQLNEARAAQAATGAGFVMSNLAGMDADPQVMLDFALAAGMVTQEAHATQTAYLKVAEAINTGTQSAEMGAQLANNISGALVRLDGERFTTYVDVIVNWIGKTNIFGGAGGLNQANQAAVHNCFAGDTLILMADGSEKQIRDVRVGDKVTSWDALSNRLIFAPVSEVFHHTPDEMGEYYLIINESVTVTPNHPIFVNGDWQDAGTVKYGDVLKTPYGEVGVSSVVRVYSQIETYNLHIDDANHNYFADGILAHNKAGGGWINAPGDGTRDTIMVPLANKEFVVNAAAAEQFAPLLEAINEGRFAMGMAAGGAVAKSARAVPGRGGFRRGTTLGSRGGNFSSLALSGGDVGVIVEEAAADLAPSVSAAVADVVAQTVTNSPQITALAQSVAVFEEMNETLGLILAKTPSGGDIGRAVNGDLARQT